MNNVIYAKPDYNVHRALAGSPVALDSANLTTLKADNPHGPMDCGGFETVAVAVSITAAGAADVTLQPLEAIMLPDGTWEFRVLAGNIGPINEASLIQEVTVYGGRLFLRLHATNGNPTAVDILVAGSVTTPGSPGRNRRR